MTKQRIILDMARMEPGERETLMRWDDDEKVVVVWSASGPVLRKLLKLGFEPTHEARRHDGRLHGCEFRVPLEQFRWGLKRRAAQKRPAVCPEPPVERVSRTRSLTEGAKPGRAA